MKKTILHCDLNCFFASVEMLYHPEYRNVPMAVAGDKENRHGIILAKNVPAKQNGVKTAETIGDAQKKCPDLILVKPDYPSYEYFSQKVRDLYYEYTDRIEPFGVDECWLDITASISYFGSVEKIVTDLLYRVKNEIGLTLSIGVSFSKVYAKLGSDMAKEDSAYYIDSLDDIRFLSVSKLLFVGAHTAETLKIHGISTIGQLADSSPSYLKTILGKSGLTLYRYANGIDENSIGIFEQKKEDVKSISNSLTSPKDLCDLDDVRIVLTILSQNIASRLRKKGLYYRTVHLFVRTNKLKVRTFQVSLKENSDLAKEIYDHALALFEEHCDFSIPYRSIGAAVSHLSENKDCFQTSFFESSSYSLKERKQEMAMEEIRRRFGKDSINLLRAYEDSVLSKQELKNSDLISMLREDSR